MTTQMTATGITFPDSTTQTTAASASPIPSGSVMLFYQSAAPTGWTQVTSLNDYALRLVSGSGGTTGGTTAFSTVFSNQTVSTTTTISGTTGATTLSTTQIPSHTHSVPSGSGSQGATAGCQGSYATSGGQTTGATGGGGSHTHSFSGSGSGTSSAVTLNVQYANIIICSKN